MSLRSLGRPSEAERIQQAYEPQVFAAQQTGQPLTPEVQQMADWLQQQKTVEAESAARKAAAEEQRKIEGAAKVKAATLQSPVAKDLFASLFSDPEAPTRFDITPDGLPVYDFSGQVAAPAGRPPGQLTPFGSTYGPDGKLYTLYQVLGDERRTGDWDIETNQPVTTRDKIGYVVGPPQEPQRSGGRFGGFFGGLLDSVSSMISEVPILPLALNFGLPGLGSALTVANAAYTGNVPAAVAGLISLPGASNFLPNITGVPEAFAPAVNQAVSAGVKTALSGGDLGDVLSSAAVGGAGSAILGEVGKVIKEALPEGTDPALANIITKTAVSTLMGKDPLSAAVGAATKEAMKPQPGLYTEPVMVDEFGVREQAPGGVDDFVGPQLPPGYTAPAFDEFMGTLFPPSEAAPTGDPLKDLLTQLGEYKEPGVTELQDVAAPAVPPSDVVGPPAPTELQRPSVQEVTLPGAVTGPLAPVTMEPPEAGMSDIEQLIREEERTAPTGMIPIIEDKPAEIIAPPTPQSQVADSFQRLNDALGYEQYDSSYVDTLLNSGMSDEELANLSNSLNDAVDQLMLAKQPTEDTFTESADEFDITDVLPSTGMSDAERLIREGETGVIDTTGMSDAERLIREGETGVSDKAQLPYDELAAESTATAQQNYLNLFPYDELAAIDTAEAQQRTGGGEDVLYQEEAGKDLAQAQQDLLEQFYQEEVGKQTGEAQQKFLDSGEVLEELVKPTTPSVKPTTPKPVVRPPVDYQKVIDNAVQNLGSQITSQQQQSSLLGLLSMLGMMGAQTPAQAQPPAYQYADIGEITPFEEMFTPYSGTAPTPTQRRV